MREYCLTGLLIASLLIGCVSEPEKSDVIITDVLIERGRQSIKKIKESDQHQIIGYLEEARFDVRDEEVSHRIYYVKNKYFKLLGFVTEKSATYRYNKEGKPEHIGDFILETAIGKLLEFTGTIYLEDFEVPLFFEEE